jgi:DNA helicase TIP49 (TBP-interacting protein)
MCVTANGGTTGTAGAAGEDVAVVVEAMLSETEYVTLPKGTVTKRTSPERAMTHETMTTVAVRTVPSEREGVDALIARKEECRW